jgi:hypothetical protein
MPSVASNMAPLCGFKMCESNSRSPGFLATVALKKLASRELDASVGASGPHDFAVRKKSAFVNAPLASTASRPAFVTIASRPSVWDGTTETCR